nr:unnamed protein product [Callosobruchus analis]
MTVNCGVDPEALEQLRRSHNILILVVPESANENEYVTGILDQVDQVANLHRLSTFRVGSVSATDRARPIKVCFATPAIAKAILQKKCFGDPPVI